MPLYRIHLRTPDGLQRDEDGLTFADLETAYLEAYRSIPDLAQEMLVAGHDPLACAFVITDAADRLLMEVAFRERVREQNRRPSADVPRPPASCEIERAHQLVGEFRLQHKQLQGNLARMRALLTNAPGSGTTP